MSETSSSSIAVVGAGPGGYAAAFLAADLGMQVTLIDPEVNPGGVCLYRGCIPSKALLHVAKLIEESEQARTGGSNFLRRRSIWCGCAAGKRGVVKKLTGGLGILSRRRHVEYIRGRAGFENSATLPVSEESGRYWKFAVSTGLLSLRVHGPAIIPALKLDSPRLMDSTGGLNLEDIPGSLLVVGGGYIGLELGSVYAALGTRVTVVMLPGLLPGADRSTGSSAAQTPGENVRSNSAEHHRRFPEGRWRWNPCDLRRRGGTRQRPRKDFRPRAGLGGAQTELGDPGARTREVRVSPRQIVEVSKQLQTADPSIYAIGDVVGEPMLAHKAMHEGRTAVEAIAGHKVAFEPAAIPAVVFADFRRLLGAV